MTNEQELLAGARRLDPWALAETHDTYYPAIFRFIAYKVGNRETAEDLTSEVFVRLLDTLRGSHAPQNTLKGWLYAVASNVVKDYYRKRNSRHQEVELFDTLPCAELKPAEQVIQKQTLECLQEALDQLTDDQRQVIVLRFGWEMSIKDIAEMMDKSEGAVKQLQARAVSSLARILNPQQQPINP